MNGPKICFINPKWHICMDPEFNEFWKASVTPNLIRNTYSGFGLSILILAALTPKGYEIEIIDENLSQVDFDRDYDLVAVTSCTQQATRAYEISKKFRRKKVKTVLGGIHPTVCSDEASENADAVVIGESEDLWPGLLRDFEASKLKKKYKQRKLYDLKKAPLPRYDLVKYLNYKMYWIQTTRGCPHDCNFCVASNIFGRRFRFKSVEQVVEEIKFIKSVSLNPRISFADDNMFVNKNYSKSLLEKIIPLNIRWFAQTDVSVAEDMELLKLLKKSGCSILFIGFESLSEEELKNVNEKNWKAKKVKYYGEYIHKIQSMGIGIFGAFMIGFDSEDADSIRHTCDFIKKSNIYAPQISVLTPYPGCALREQLAAQHRILDRDWNYYTGLDVTFKPNKMSEKELQRQLVSSLKSIYNREYLENNIRYFKDIFKNN
jgi:radical SAM superfamily enzyme YgiQ (UPF0313 family)